MRRLIINADDLGGNPSRSHGIFQCMEEGVVTSATILPNLIESDRAAELARRKESAVGLHINLTEGSPLSNTRDVASLLDGNNYFLAHDRLLAALESGSIQKEHLEREMRAQLEWFLERIGSPTHVASHKHVHIHPFIAPILAPILSRYGIRFVRIPEEEVADKLQWELTEQDVADVRHISEQAHAARSVFTAEDIGFTDHFRGLTLQNHAAAKRLRQIIAFLPEGTTELMVHPGQCDPGGDEFDRDAQRETERNMLLDPGLIGELKSRQIELCSFADL